MEIIIATVPHKNQRYDTVGDWRLDRPVDAVSGADLGYDRLTITVSDTGDWAYNSALAVHELVEALLCKAAGVSQEAVDAFDMAWQGDGEPGDDPKAPYHEQHVTATEHEMDLVTQLGCDWGEYDAAMLAL